MSPSFGLRSCAACLHAIVAPESAILYDGCFFHAGHLPAEALVAA